MTDLFLKGTGQALIKNKSSLIEKNITVDGVDYDLDYVKECRRHIKAEKLENYITVCHRSILDFNLPYCLATYKSNKSKNSFNSLLIFV